jgi:hypothetical protein
MMHVSWTTLQEQIFAKLRRPYRSEANMNEVGHGLARLVITISADDALNGLIFPTPTQPRISFERAIFYFLCNY